MGVIIEAWDALTTGAGVPTSASGYLPVQRLRTLIDFFSEEGVIPHEGCP